jgi:hypothetical protein
MKLGEWISNGTNRPFYARKEFALMGKINKAAIYVTGLGQFILSLNGKQVGDHVLDPAWTNYNKIIQYVVFDITDLLKEGPNVLGLEIGNGWYIRDFRRYFMKYPPFKPPIPNPYKPFSKYLAASLCLEIDFIDGSNRLIFTDGNWKVRVHPVTLSNVYGSEIIDGRLTQHGWNEPGFNDALWKPALVLSPEDAPKGCLTEQKQPPVKIKKVYDAEYLHTKENEQIYDLKQNMSGILEFEAKGNRGETIDVLPTEKLKSDGSVDQEAKGWGLIDVTETYIIGQDDAWETFRMAFTYFAGRYLAIKTASETVEIRNIKAHYITNASKDAGSFECDDERYNRIYDLVLKAVECNLLSVHTDCPTIERFAWQEPNHLMAPSIMYMKDAALLWEKFLLDLRTDQIGKGEKYADGNGGYIYPGEGLMPAIAPRYESNVIPSPFGSFFDIIPWGSFCILGTYWHYMFYGDKRVIRDNYEGCMKYLDYLKTRITADGFINHGLGDWGNPDKKALARENIETVFLFADAKVLSFFASALDLKEDESELAAFADSVKDNYNRLLLRKHPEKGYYCYPVWDQKNEFYLTQACQAMPLYWKMVPPEKESDVKKAFSDIVKRDGSFISGEIALPYIIQTMNHCGMNDSICDFILKEQHPSYYAFVKDGETTLGEFWESNPRSHCHDMMGHIIEWYYNGLAGIIPLVPGFSKVKIRPYLPASINRFSCSYDSASGRITVCLERHGNQITVKLAVPHGIECVKDASELEKNGFAVEWITGRSIK